MLSKPHRYETLARGSALFAGGITLLLYLVFILENPYSGSEQAQNSVFLMTIVAALAGMQIWGAWNKLPFMVLLAFTFSFLPTGMYMLGKPGVFRWIGVAHLLYLLVALFTWMNRREIRSNQKAAVEAAAMNSE